MAMTAISVTMMEMTAPCLNDLLWDISLFFIVLNLKDGYHLRLSSTIFVPKRNTKVTVRK